ncbi:MAG TPA: hypothetical protein VM328_09085 [Fimbriimonadaceae bacterium]|nr:hypothetical protein [Fimbriimonadaceae bacterium]
MSARPAAVPAWYKNTYFWLAAILFMIALYGLPFLGGENAIRDPGQKRESGLSLYYFGGAVLMLVNGLLSHWQTLRHYREHVASLESSTVASEELATGDRLDLSAAPEEDAQRISKGGTD